MHSNEIDSASLSSSSSSRRRRRHVVRSRETNLLKPTSKRREDQTKPTTTQSTQHTRKPPRTTKGHHEEHVPCCSNSVQAENEERQREQEVAADTKGGRNRDPLPFPGNLQVGPSPSICAPAREVREGNRGPLPPGGVGGDRPFPPLILLLRTLFCFLSLLILS